MLRKFVLAGLFLYFHKVGNESFSNGIGWSEMVVDLTLSSKQRSLVINVARPSEYENIIARN